MKGLMVLLALLAVIAGAVMGAGYYLYGDRFYDIITAAEARLGAVSKPSGDPSSEPETNTDAAAVGAEGGNATAGQNADRPRGAALPRTARPVRFEDPEARFAAVFPGPVSRFDNYLSGLVPDLISTSQTYAASGVDIVAQVSILNWRDEVRATAEDLANGFADDPDRTMGEAAAQAILSALLGDTATVEGVRGFTAYGRQSVELTGLTPDGDGGQHRSVVWLMPGADNLIAVVIRAYSDRGLLGAEATQFNQNFSLQIAEVPGLGIPQ